MTPTALCNINHPHNDTHGFVQYQPPSKWHSQLCAILTTLKMTLTALCNIVLQLQLHRTTQLVVDHQGRANGDHFASGSFDCDVENDASRGHLGVLQFNIGSIFTYSPQQK